LSKNADTDITSQVLLEKCEDNKGVIRRRK